MARGAERGSSVVERPARLEGDAEAQRGHGTAFLALGI
jgi:hypothetical protein